MPDMAETQLYLILDESPGRVRLHARTDPERPRNRIRSRTSPRLRGWLVRATRAHGHLVRVVRLFSNPFGASVGGPIEDDYLARADRGDRTLLHDALALCHEEIGLIMAEVAEVIDSPTPTSAKPGSAAKVIEMERRRLAGYALFARGDRKR